MGVQVMSGCKIVECLRKVSASVSVQILVRAYRLSIRRCDSILYHQYLCSQLQTAPSDWKAYIGHYLRAEALAPRVADTSLTLIEQCWNHYEPHPLGNSTTKGLFAKNLTTEQLWIRQTEETFHTSEINKVIGGPHIHGTRVRSVTVEVKVLWRYRE